MALTSACAVGSQSGVTRFTPVAMILPSRAMTAPKGPPPATTFSSESRMAILISSSLLRGAACFVSCAADPLCGCCACAGNAARSNAELRITINFFMSDSY